ncbi:hypothetical protein MYX82_01235 [Acidobacteria bacterium AH-259-D05]|nr:hypothetical protein [Acidobacteria bacterium AH-259-D05]
MAWNNPYPETPEQRLTRQFYQWEERGRGWQVWPYPVELEPPFTPFFSYSTPPATKIDDGRRSTFLSSLVEGVRDLLAVSSSQPPQSPVMIPEGDRDEPLPTPSLERFGFLELRISLPPDYSVQKETMERFLLALKYCSEPLSFEILGLPESIRIQLACSSADQDQVRQQLQAYFPDVVVQETEGFLSELWDDMGSKSTTVVDLGLSQEFMRPLQIFKSFEPDPLIAITGALADVRQGELGLLQVLFQHTRSPWPESIMRSVTDWEGKAFFTDAPEMVPLAKQKVSSPLFAVVIRIAAQSPTYGRARQIATAIGSAFAQFSDPASNEFIPLNNDCYADIDQHEDILFRRTHRSGMLLNAQELLGIVHFPSARRFDPKRLNVRTNGLGRFRQLLSVIR